MSAQERVVDIGINAEADQYVPPVLGFDALYLYPNETFDKTAREYQEYLQDRQQYFSARARREEAEAREAAMRASQAASETNKLEAERKAREEETRRANELHSEQLREQHKHFKQTLEHNETLKQEASNARDAKWAAEALTKRVQTAAQERLSRACSRLMVTGCILVVGSGWFAYRAGFSRGYKQDLESELSQLQADKAELVSKVSGLEEDVKRLTPPPAPAPPTLTEEEAQSELQQRYHALDVAQDEEQTSTFFAFYAPNYVLETNGFTNDRPAFKDSLRHDLFQDNLLHQQITQINQLSEAPRESEDAHKEESSSSSTTETKTSPVEVIDNDTVVVPVTRTIYKWARVQAVAPPPAETISSFSSSGASPDPEETKTTETKMPSPPSATTYADKNTKQVYAQRDTWKRKEGEWFLTKSEVLSVSETPSNETIPTLKCRNITCGSLYVNGVETPFTPDGKAVKACPVCGRQLYFPRSR